MQQVRPEEIALDLHGREYDESGVFIVSPETRSKLVGDCWKLTFLPDEKLPNLRLENNTMMGAAYAVGPFSAVSTS